MSLSHNISSAWLNLSKQNSLSGLITTNLISIFDAARTLCYPGTGSTCTDLVGTVTGTLTNGPTFNSNNLGYFTLDGVDDEIRFNNGANVYNPILIPTGNWSVYFWIKTVTSNGSLLADWSGGPANMAFNISNGKLSFMWYNVNGWHITTSTGANVNTNNWTLITYTASSGNLGPIKMYINGVLDYSYTSTETIGGGNMTTFGRYWGGNFFNGNLSMLMVYSTEHTISQIQQQFNVHRKRYGI